MEDEEVRCKRKSEKKNDGCKGSLQPLSEWERKKQKILDDGVKSYYSARSIHKPAIRVNSSKGIHYVQYKDAYGNWNTIGKLSAKNLGTAFGMRMDDIDDHERKKWKAHGIRKGVITDLETEEEFDRASRDFQGKLDAYVKTFLDRRKLTRKKKKQMKALIRVMKPEVQRERREEAREEGTKRREEKVVDTTQEASTPT